MRFIFTFIVLYSPFCNAQIITTEIISPKNSFRPDNWVVFKAPDYSISYPESWTMDTSKVMGIDLFIFSKADTTNDNFRENVNVMSSELNGRKLSLDSFIAVSVREIRTLATDYKILESKRYNETGFRFHKIDFTAKQGIFELRFIQYYLVTEKKAYTITLTTEKEKYDSYKETGMKILNSFVLTN